MFEKHVMILFQDNAHLSSVCTDDFFDEAVIKVFILPFSAAVIYASYAESWGGKVEICPFANSADAQKPSTATIWLLHNVYKSF